MLTVRKGRIDGPGQPQIVGMDDKQPCVGAVAQSPAKGLRLRHVIAAELLPPSCIAPIAFPELEGKPFQET